MIKKIIYSIIAIILSSVVLAGLAYFVFTNVKLNNGNDNTLNVRQAEQKEDLNQYSIEPVSIEKVDNLYYKVIMDYNCGASHEEMGRFLGKKIKAIVPDYEEEIDSYLSVDIKSSGMKVSEDRNKDLLSEYIKNAQEIMKNVDKDYMDEINGMAYELCNGDKDVAGDKKLTRNELYLFNLLPDIKNKIFSTACSVYGSKTEDGKTITGKTFAQPQQLKNLNSVTIYKQGEKSFCNIGFLGMAGTSTGFNDNKVFASVIDTPTRLLDNVKGCNSIFFDLRHALENDNTIDDIAGYMADEKHNYHMDHIVFLSDPTISKVLENDLRIGGKDVKRAIREADSNIGRNDITNFTDAIVAVNSFQLPGNFCGVIQYDDYKNWMIYRSMLNMHNSTINYEDLKNMMSSVSISPVSEGSSYYNIVLTQSIMIFKPEDMKLQIALSKGGDKNLKDSDYLEVPVSFN